MENRVESQEEQQEEVGSNKVAVLFYRYLMLGTTLLLPQPYQP